MCTKFSHGMPHDPVDFTLSQVNSYHLFHVLQDSLGGDAKALMFCNLAPHPLHASETLSSLAFASKVSSVVLKTPLRRVEEVKEDDGGDPYTAPNSDRGNGGTPSGGGAFGNLGGPPIGLTTPTASSSAKGGTKITPRGRVSSSRQQ